MWGLEKAYKEDMSSSLTGVLIIFYVMCLFITISVPRTLRHLGNKSFHFIQLAKYKYKYKNKKHIFFYLFFKKQCLSGKYI